MATNLPCQTLEMPHRWIFSHAEKPDAALQALLDRMRRRLYPETLPALASCWLKTLCSSGHNRAWWLQLKDSLDRTLRDEPLDPFPRDVLRSARDWTQHALSSELPSTRRYLDPPFRTLPLERLVVYLGRLLNEWLPTELAQMLTEEDDRGTSPDAGIPALAVAKALDRLLLRERLSPETLEQFLAPDLLSPQLFYPADVEILHDVVLALLGRVSAPGLPILPAVLLTTTGAAILPPGASLEQSDAGEELHVPITETDALQLLSHDPLRIGSVVLTMDGRMWQPWKLHRGDQNLIAYRPATQLRIDCTADHCKLAVPWPENMPSSWSGAAPTAGPFELFGREWRSAGWEMDGESTILHLTFSRVLPIVDPAPRHLADIAMAWSEVERALAEALSRNTRDPIEQMRRTDLIPFTRSLYAFAESVQSKWPSDTQLNAIRYHHAAVNPVYGLAPWRTLPPPIQAVLVRKPMPLLAGIFTDLPKSFAPPSRAA
jgi:hypothetical protein